MKWGVRRYQNPNGTLTLEGKKRYEVSNDKNNSDSVLPKSIFFSNEKVKLIKEDPSKFVKFMSSIIPGFSERNKNIYSYKIFTKDNLKVGEYYLNTIDSNRVDLEWLHVSSKYENLGYGSSAMRSILRVLVDVGYKKATLEVPGSSPNAKHIYEKLGFVVNGPDITGPDDIIWGGLTPMVIDLSKISNKKK